VFDLFKKSAIGKTNRDIVLVTTNINADMSFLRVALIHDGLSNSHEYDLPASD